MKLKGKSIFDVATIVIIDNGELYSEDVMCILSCEKWPECLEKSPQSISILISKNLNFDGHIMFWIENDNAYPLLKLKDVYFIELDPIYEDCKERGIFSEDEVWLVDEGFKLINRPYSEGGIIDSNGV